MAVIPKRLSAVISPNPKYAKTPLLQNERFRFSIVVNGIHYMNDLGLFLFKDIIALGVAFFLIAHYGQRAITAENQR